MNSKRDILYHQAASRPSDSVCNWSNGSLRRIDLDVYKSHQSNLNLTKRVVAAAAAAATKSNADKSENSKGSSALSATRSRSRPITAASDYSLHTVFCPAIRSL